jgi:hypothetical protein
MLEVLTMRSFKLSAIVVLGACTASAGSGDAASDLTLAVEPATVAAGDSVTLILGNESASAIGYNLCTSSLERQTDGSWQPLPSDRVCTMELRTLEPGAQTRYPLSLPAALESGEYRYRTTVELMETGERRDVESEVFRVGSGPTRSASAP